MSDLSLSERRMQPRRVGLESVLAGVRKVESGSYQGDYQMRGPRYNGRTYYGAYQMPADDWGTWAAYAGIAGADMRSPAAQDAVAASMLLGYYDRFQSWDLAAMAWYAGPGEAGKVAARGYGGISTIRNPKIRDYMKEVDAAAQYAVEHPNEAYTVKIPAYQLAQASPGSGWVMPVAGANEYSNSFYVPRTNNKTGIHGAIDIYAEEGTPIVSPVAGRVIQTNTGELGGNTVRILGNDGVTYYFAHMAAHAVVSVGDIVHAGYHLGYVGRTGSARHTSPHLHFSMHLGSKLINPYTYLQGSSSVGVNAMPAASSMALDIGPQQTVGGNTTSWLQKMSNAVRAGAINDDLAEEKESEPAAEPVAANMAPTMSTQPRAV